MDDPKDLHICGHCRKIYDNVELFITHKSGCNQPNNIEHEIQLNDQIIQGNEIFSTVDLLDPAALKDGSFPLILQYENEEVVGDTSSCQFLVYGENLNEGLSSYSIQPSKNVNEEEINEEDIANLLITQLSKEVISKNHQFPINQDSYVENTEELLEERIESVDLMKHAIENELQFFEESARENVSKKKDRFSCSICNFVPTFPRDLVRHMRKHTGERPYTCKVCDKMFARQDKLVAHNRIHTGDKPYKCHLCAYTTADGPALRKHMLIHTDERPHKCQLCSYTARNSSHMIIHLRKHTGDSPFFCQLETCGLTFKTSSDLKRHMDKHKQANLSPYSTFDDMSDKSCSKHVFKQGKLVNKLSCNFCQDYVYGGPTNRKKGMRKKGKKRSWLAKAHECPHCNAAFVRPDSLRSHMRLHQQEDTRLTDKPVAQDGEEPEKETNCLGSQSSQLVSPAGTSNQVPELFYVDNVDLQDSLISLDQDGTIQSIVNTSLL